MRINLPVTDQEILVPHDKTLVTKTDIKGIITFANQDFIDISGFTNEQLVGTNHNIIRHPDMPAAVFEMMWKTLKNGLAWRGIIKNRCRNGDYYWVDANIVPIKKKSQIIGYMSVRTFASRTDIANAEEIYQASATQPEILKEKAPLNWKKHVSFKNGIPAWIFMVTLMMIVGTIFAIGGLTQAESTIKEHHESMKSAQLINQIKMLMEENRSKVSEALNDTISSHSGIKHGNTLHSEIQALVKNEDEINLLWSNYSKLVNGSAESNLAENFSQAKNSYYQDGILKTIQAIKSNDYKQGQQLLYYNLGPLYEKAENSASAILGFLNDREQVEFATSSMRTQRVIYIEIAGICINFLILVISGISFYLLTSIPLNKTVQSLENIAEGSLSDHIDPVGYGESGRIMFAVMTMQMHLKVMMHEIAQSANSIHKQCKELNNVMMNLAVQSGEQHDRSHQTLLSLTDSCSNIVDKASSVQSLMVYDNSVDGKNPVETNANESEFTVLEALSPEMQNMLENAVLADVNNDQLTSSTSAPAQSTINTSALESSDHYVSSILTDDFKAQVQGLTIAVMTHSFVTEELSEQLTQINALADKNDKDLQDAWTATQRLAITALELEQLIKYFS